MTVLQFNILKVVCFVACIGGATAILLAGGEHGWGWLLFFAFLIACTSKDDA